MALSTKNALKSNKNAIKNAKERDAQRNVNSREADFNRYSKGGGFNDWLKRHTAATKKSDKMAQFVFKLFVLAAPFTKYRLTNWIIKKVAKLGDTYNTKGVSIPIYVDTSMQSINIPVEFKTSIITPPVELMKDTIRKSEYRVILDECICRKMGDCKDYPLDVACLFLGRASEACVRNGIGHEATVEECLAHIDKATEAGLSAAAYFIEFEQYAWGIEDAGIPNYMAFCYCCPCCCNSIKFENLASGELKHITQQPIGWRNELIPENCTKCGACVEVCPRHYISIKNGKIEIDDTCPGCGQCLKVCPNEALHVVQYGETKKDLQDGYFSKQNAKW